MFIVVRKLVNKNTMTTFKQICYFSVCTQIKKHNSETKGSNLGNKGESLATVINKWTTALVEHSDSGGKT